MTHPQANRFAHSLSLLCAGIAALAGAWAIWRSILPLEIDPNEAWNAWWADAVFSASGLYPDPQALIANNYPPLYFVVLHALSKLTGANAIDCGRWLSLISILAICGSLHVMLRSFGQMTAAMARAGALWCLALFFTYFSRYAAMNDPQFFAVAVMLGGMIVSLRKPEQSSRLLAGAAIMVVAGFIKHSLWAMPLTTFLFLLWTAPKRAAEFALAGLVFAALGLAICGGVWGGGVFEQLTMPRHASWAAAFCHLPGLAWFYAAAIVFAWSSRGRWAEPLTRFAATFLVIAFLVDILQRRGDGVDINAEMELAIASAFAVSLSLQRLLSGAASSLSKGAMAVLVLLPFLDAFPLSAVHMYRSDWRQSVASRVNNLKQEVNRVTAMEGNLACQPASVCYRAGKPNIFDFFITAQRVKTGIWTDADLQAKISAAGIRFAAMDASLAW